MKKLIIIILAVVFLGGGCLFYDTSENSAENKAESQASSPAFDCGTGRVLSDDGKTCECEYGYAQSSIMKGACVKVECTRSHEIMNEAGDGCECEEGYRRSEYLRGMCILDKKKENQQDE